MPTESTLICYRTVCSNAAHVLGYNRVTHGMYCISCAIAISLNSVSGGPLFPLLLIPIDALAGGSWTVGLIRIRPPANIYDTIPPGVQVTADETQELFDQINTHVSGNDDADALPCMCVVLPGLPSATGHFTHPHYVCSACHSSEGFVYTYPVDPPRGLRCASCGDVSYSWGTLDAQGFAWVPDSTEIESTIRGPGNE